MLWTRRGVSAHWHASYVPPSPYPSASRQTFLSWTLLLSSFTGSFPPVFETLAPSNSNTKRTLFHVVNRRRGFSQIAPASGLQTLTINLRVHAGDEFTGLELSRGNCVIIGFAGSDAHRRRISLNSWENDWKAYHSVHFYVCLSTMMLGEWAVFVTSRNFSSRVGLLILNESACLERCSSVAAFFWGSFWNAWLELYSIGKYLIYSYFYFLLLSSCIKRAPYSRVSNNFKICMAIIPPPPFYLHIASFSQSHGNGQWLTRVTIVHIIIDISGAERQTYRLLVIWRSEFSWIIS